MTNKPRVVAVIPARYGSTRFPGKPLALIAGRPMIQWVYEAACACPSIDLVLVATDDMRISSVVEEFGGQAAMTSTDHQTGTDRIAEAVKGMSADLVLNLQGDEPLLPSEVLQALIDGMIASGAEMGTAAVPFSCTDRDPADPNAVKVVVDENGCALYFSRACVPFCRDGGTAVEPLLHWGIYAYRQEFLESFVNWPRGRLEKCEMLEQLRALENGAKIFVVQTRQQSAGVDVPEDIEHVERILKNRRETNSGC
ncbi:MAG: 3-deoxy-manno-octulosonate cytidylyltransferase [Lentisphaeria bacterium]|nr:3-deoxy-manno-octulosonate cytidylyltransferase [Lentisphaeria bacterium]